MPGSHLLLPAGGRKVTTLPFPKRRHHRHRFRKQTDLNSTAAAILDGPGSSSVGPAGSSSAGLVGFFESAAAASAPSGNSVRNCIEFCHFG